MACASILFPSSRRPLQLLRPVRQFARKLGSVAADRERRPARRRSRTGRFRKRRDAGLGRGRTPGGATCGTSGHRIAGGSARGAEEPAARARERRVHRRRRHPVTSDGTPARPGPALSA